MGKVMMIGLFVLGIWAATEYAAGTNPFSGTERHDEPREAASAAARVGSKVGAAYADENARREALLAE